MIIADTDAAGRASPGGGARWSSREPRLQAIRAEMQAIAERSFGTRDLARPPPAGRDRARGGGPAGGVALPVLQRLRGGLGAVRRAARGRAWALLLGRGAPGAPRERVLPGGAARGRHRHPRPGLEPRAAIEQMIDATGWPRELLAAEVDRYGASPGQALGYMVGALEIRRLRREVARALRGTAPTQTGAPFRRAASSLAGWSFDQILRRYASRAGTSASVNGRSCTGGTTPGCVVRRGAAGAWMATRLKNAL